MRILSQDRSFIIDALRIHFKKNGTIIAECFDNDYAEIAKYSNWNDARKVIEDMACFFAEKPDSVYFMPYRCDVDYLEEH